MKTKVCPCCDQPLNGIYCKGCRKIVLNPVEQDVHYYLNTRHPRNETDCSFHGNTASEVRTSDHVMTPFETEAKKAEIKERMQMRKRERKSGAKIAQNAKWNAERAAQNTRNTVLNGDVLHPQKEIRSRSPVAIMVPFLIIFITILIITLFFIINTAHPTVYDFSAGHVLPEPQIAPVVTAAEPEPEEALAVTAAEPEPEEALAATVTDPNDWERTDEEVKAAGIACTGYGHFDVTYEDALLSFLGCIEDAGYMWSEEAPYSYNQVIDYDSWFQTVYSFSIESEDDYIGMMEIETDTATGQIHGISMYTIKGESFFAMADIAMKFIEEVGMTDEKLPSGWEFYEEAMEGPGKTMREEGFRMMYDLEVSCYVPENIKSPDFYSMSILAPGYYTEN